MTWLAAFPDVAYAPAARTWQQRGRSSVGGKQGGTADLG